MNRNTFRKLVGLFLLLLSASGTYAQNRPATPSSNPAKVQAQVTNRSLDVQWEYLVVSYGKTVFGAPEKTLAYRSIGLSATAQEANEVQRSLDVLGRFGWEVVTIVGTIGGDQQIVFKRRYDRNRSVNEGSEILKGREVFLRDLLDIMQRENRIREEADAAAHAERNKPRLIELDAFEAAQNRERLSAERRAALETVVSGTAWGSRVVIKVRADQAFTFVDAVLDGTPEFLKEGNTYRQSDVTRWVRANLLSTLQNAVVPFGGSIFITTTTNITFNGTITRVDEQKKNYSSISGRWN